MPFIFEKKEEKKEEEKTDAGMIAREAHKKNLEDREEKDKEISKEKD